MNSCILMAEIVGDTELRSTQDGMQVSNVLIEFSGAREGDPSAKIRLVGWGSLAEEIKNNYHQGDRVIVEGRLSMNLIEMPEGYKEKRAELVASRIYPLGSAGSFTTASETNNQSEFEPAAVSEQSSNYVSSSNTADFPSAPEPEATPAYSNSNAAVTDSSPADSADGNWDEIPFMRPIYSKTNFGTELCDSWELAANRYWDGIKSIF